MIDRELLEAAAAAYFGALGSQWRWNDTIYQCIEHLTPSGIWRPWSPLTDDGDALRLETALAMKVIWFNNCVMVGETIEHFASHDMDRNKARRWAGVRAAASLGERGKG